MKFINYLESITGIGIFPLTSFMIFFGFFTAVGLYIMLGKRDYFKQASKLPLDQNEQ